MNETLRKNRMANLDRKRRAEGVEQIEGIYEEQVPKEPTVEDPMEEYVSDLVDESCQNQPEEQLEEVNRDETEVRVSRYVSLSQL